VNQHVNAGWSRGWSDDPGERLAGGDSEGGDGDGDGELEVLPAMVKASVVGQADGLAEGVGPGPHEREVSKQGQRDVGDV
jgi:hypothetical protein